MAEREKGLYRKLAAVQQAITYLQKQKPKAGTLKYTYVSSTNVLETIRPIMDEQGLLCLVEVVSAEVLPGAAFGGKNHLMRADLRFTWIDADKPEEREVLLGVGYGAGDDEKSIGKAITYGEKYHILKLFHIPTDDDDPDAHQEQSERAGQAKSAGGNGNGKPAPAAMPAEPPPSTSTPEEIRDSILNGKDLMAALKVLGVPNMEGCNQCKLEAGFGARDWKDLNMNELRRVYAVAAGLTPAYDADGQVVNPKEAEG